MIPGATFRAVRLRLGLSQADVGREAGIAQAEVSRFERGSLHGGTPEYWRRVRAGLAACWQRDRKQQARAAYRAVWAAQWPASLSARHFLQQAADQLDVWGDHETADWLLACRPGWLTEVCTGVAAYALRDWPTPHDGERWQHPWDILGEAGLLDIIRAIDLFDNGDGDEFGGMLTWAPQPHWLLGPVPCL